MATRNLALRRDRRDVQGRSRHEHDACLSRLAVLAVAQMRATDPRRDLDEDIPMPRNVICPPVAQSPVAQSNVCGPMLGVKQIVARLLSNV